MNLLHSLHMLLTGNSYTRKYQHRLTRKIKRTMRCPDAFADIIDVVRVAKPAALIDIGSYVGETIARFLDDIHIPVYGFEPTPDSYQKLNQRFADNPLVHLFNLALSDKPNKQKLFLNSNPQTNSLLDNDAGNIASFPKDTVHLDEIKVDVTTLDLWLPDHIPNGQLIIKADIQGAEGRLLEGGKNAFSNRVIAFYSEAQIEPMYKEQIAFCDLHERLNNEFGFSIYNIYKCGRDDSGKAVQTDILWVKKNFFK